MKRLKHFARLYATVVLTILLTGSLAYSAPNIRQDLQKPNVIQKPGTAVTIPPVAAQRLGGGNDGSVISNVKVTAQSEFYTGTVAFVNWSWPGHEKDAVDILINGKKINKEPWTRGPQYNFYVPYDLDQRDYAVTVRSAYDTSNKSSGRIDVKSSYIQFTRSPELNAYYLQNTPLRMEWLYKGNPGPVKLELYATYNSTPVATIKPNLPPGNYGAGSFAWTIPQNIPNGRYYVSMTSLASSRLSADSPQFGIGKPDAPVLKKIEPQATFTGGKMTVTAEDFRDMSSWSPVVELQNGQTFAPAIQWITPSQFKITTPAIYAAFGNTPDPAILKIMGQAKSFYLKKGNITSNKLPINILYMTPLIEKLSANTVTPGQKIEVTGGNWNNNLLFIQNQYRVILELPGASVSIFPQPAAGGFSGTPVQLYPVNVLNSSFSITVPEVFCSVSKSVQDAIQNGTGKLALLSNTFGLSNKIDIKIRKKPVQGVNPSVVTLRATYTPNAPNRTLQYNSDTYMAAPNCQKVTVSTVKNNSNFPVQLAYKKSVLDKFTNYIPLAPGQSTTAFNGKDYAGSWEAIGPESGSFSGKYYSVALQIGWQAN